MEKFKYIGLIKLASLYYFSVYAVAFVFYFAIGDGRVNGRWLLLAAVVVYLPFIGFCLVYNWLKKYLVKKL